MLFLFTYANKPESFFMSLLHRYLIILTIVITFGITPAIAEESKEKTPVTEWIEAEKKLTESLPQENVETLYLLRHKHSIIRTIEVAHSEIENAVIACGKENPEIKSDINDRLTQWEESVLPIIKDAKKSLKQEINDQTALHASDINHILKLNDKAYEYSYSKVEKTPITDLKACHKLMASMDQTEDRLITLLQQVLLPEEVIRNRAKRLKEMQEEAANQKTTLEAKKQ